MKNSVKLQSFTAQCCFLPCRYDPEVEGGHSIFLDGFYVLEELRKSHPDDFENLVRIPATFQKVHFKR